MSGSREAFKALAGRYGLGSSTERMVKALSALRAGYAEDYDKAKTPEEFLVAQGARLALKKLQDGIQAPPPVS